MWVCVEIREPKEHERLPNHCQLRVTETMNALIPKQHPKMAATSPMIAVTRPQFPIERANKSKQTDCQLCFDLSKARRSSVQPKTTLAKRCCSEIPDTALCSTFLRLGANLQKEAHSNASALTCALPTQPALNGNLKGAQGKSRP